MWKYLRLRKYAPRRAEVIEEIILKQTTGVPPGKLASLEDEIQNA